MPPFLLASKKHLFCSTIFSGSFLDLGDSTFWLFMGFSAKGHSLDINDLVLALANETIDLILLKI
tara:strand:+ start:370 stop:564 length:195 start_codon:yes stop_codon:yes gene_type:complete